MKINCIIENNERNCKFVRTTGLRMEELREEVGVRESLTRKLVRSRLKWDGHVESMEGNG